LYLTTKWLDWAGAQKSNLNALLKEPNILGEKFFHFFNPFVLKHIGTNQTNDHTIGLAAIVLPLV